MVRNAQEIWFAEKVRRAGFPDADAFAAHFGLKPYRLEQIYRAAAKELAESIAGVTPLPKELRAQLQESGFRFDSVTPVVVQRSRDAQTSKGLFRLADGAEIEAVLMEHFGDRNTVCISSQAGCAFACAFCSTGQAGFTRNLTADEIFDQAPDVRKHLHLCERLVVGLEDQDVRPLSRRCRLRRAAVLSRTDCDPSGERQHRRDRKCLPAVHRNPPGRDSVVLVIPAACVGGVQPAKGLC